MMTSSNGNIFHVLHSLKSDILVFISHSLMSALQKINQFITIGLSYFIQNVAYYQIQMQKSNISFT